MRSPEPGAPRALLWFRRDLRLYDNAGLARALHEHGPVLPVFVFDTDILHALPPADRRVEFLWHAVADLKARLQERGSDLRVLHGAAGECIPALARELGVQAVHANEDYEPDAQRRDERVMLALEADGIALRLAKDTVVFDAREVLTNQGRPYTVFTPYRTAWLRRLDAAAIAAHPSAQALAALARQAPTRMPSLGDLGFVPTGLDLDKLAPTGDGARALLARFADRVMARYHASRDLPGIGGVSFLSVYNRFGLLSIRELVRTARAAQHPSGQPSPGADTWLSELVWREFYFQFIYHHPASATGPFRAEYADMAWRNDPAEFQAWCDGQTGFPFIDAAMAQLNRTGYMHNRARMVVASFLSKDLLIDYRWGEAYFARLLLDFDLSANNGGWQWAASTGCDAQPYFRVFNPARQSEKFDPDGAYIRKYLPALAAVPARCLHEPARHAQAWTDAGVRLGVDYPLPIVDHAARRTAALRAYGEARARATAGGDAP